MIKYYETPFDDCITLLIKEALKRTGNYDTTTYTINMKKGGELNTSFLPSKWTPRGCIKLSDNILSTTTGLRGAKARAHRWFETREGLTNENGNFDVGHKFRFPVDYSIKWERNDFNIRSGTSGQAYYNGPHHRGDWNLDITGGVSWHYGHVHRGAFDYYYNNQTGLRKPPTNGFLGARIAIGVFDKGDRANYRHWQRNWFGPEIQMYTKWQDNSPRSAQAQYRTTIHELAHASHFNMHHADFRNTQDMVQESWAVGVAWSFEKLRYTYPLDWQSVTLNWISTDGEKQYTPLVIDLVDSTNQRAVSGGNLAYPIDNVSGFTIRKIEDGLKNKRTMTDWRDQLKTTKPSGVTNAQLDELFLNYTLLQ